MKRTIATIITIVLSIAIVVFAFTMSACASVNYTKPYHFLEMHVDPHRFLENTCGCDMFSLVRDEDVFMCGGFEKLVTIEVSDGVLRYVMYRYSDQEIYTEFAKQLAPAFKYIGKSWDPIVFWFSDTLTVVAFLPETLEVLFVTMGEVQRVYNKTRLDGTL